MSVPSIQVLPDHVIDQIAAGEVVERPASVVKELVENALDAGAARVTVEVEGGGRRLIRVVDDGCGMTPEEARLALVRHATSKLRALDDLVRIATMGFRGEALPSIASVSRLTLTTRARAAADRPAVRLEVEGGRVVAEEEVGAPVGTRVEVRDLLWNVPARLKFLKGEPTEAAHVSEAVLRLAMAHPSVHLTLISRGRTALDAPPSRDGLERVRALIGGRAADRLHRVARTEAGVGVEAFLGAPDLAQSTARGLHFFVGRRWVRDRGLVHAVLQGYGELVPRGRYPTGAVFVALDGAQVDVNVHPQKLEVRFSDAQAVYAAVRHAVRAAVADAPWLGEGHGGWASLGSVAGERPWAAARAPAWGGARTSTDAARDYAARLTRSLLSWRQPGAGETSARSSEPPAAGAGAQGASAAHARAVAAAAADPVAAPAASAAAAPAASAAPAAAPAPAALPLAEATSASASADTYFSRLRYLGQLDLTYLVCEGDGELVLIDQHAAHERVAFERLVAGHGQRAAPRQRLLLPQILDVDPRLSAVADEARDLLEASGFEVEPFGEASGGGTSLALRAVPSELRKGADPAALLRELLAELAEEGGSRAADERLRAVLATIACHSVVRAGDRMSPAEACSLLESLDRTPRRTHCPHGRPVMQRLAVDELARRFGR